MGKPLVILDVDETLLHATETRLALAPDFMVAEYYVYRRPGLNEFLNSASEDYRLAIWSSATEGYVRDCVANVGALSLAFGHYRNLNG